MFSSAYSDSSINDPFFLQLEKKVSTHSGPWFLRIIGKRLELESQKIIVNSFTWHVQLETFLNILVSKKKISREAYDLLSTQHLKNCMANDHGKMEHECVESILFAYRDTHGSTFFEESILKLKAQFLEKINKEKSTSNITFRLFVNTCLSAKDLDCLKQLRPFYTKLEVDLKQEDLLLYSLLETQLGNTVRANTLLDQLLKDVPEKEAPVTPALWGAYAYLFRNECEKGLSYLNKISDKNDDVPIKNMLNIYLTEIELSRICKKTPKYANDLKSILTRLDKKNLFFRLKIITEIAIHNANITNSELQKTLDLEVNEIEKTMFPESQSPRLQLTKILMIKSREQRKEALRVLEKAIKNKKDSESQYVLRFLKSI